MTPKTFIRKVQFHVQRMAFENLGIPKVKSEKISKILLKKYLPQNPIIVDCGAHNGSDSLALANLFRNGMIHSIEPLDGLFAQLSENIITFKNIKCYKLALSDRNGFQDFFISEGESDASSSLLEPALHLRDHPDTIFDNKIIVEVLTLDDWALENNIPKVDMLWLDMQGYELPILRASKNILPTVSVIHTEVSTRETYKGVALYHEYKAFLEQAGFKVLIEAIPIGWDMGNVLFVRKK